MENNSSGTQKTIKMEAVIKTTSTGEAFASFRIAGTSNMTRQEKYDNIEAAKAECEKLCAAKGLTLQWGTPNRDMNTLIGAYDVTR